MASGSLVVALDAVADVDAASCCTCDMGRLFLLRLAFLSDLDCNLATMTRAHDLFHYSVVDIRVHRLALSVSVKQWFRTLSQKMLTHLPAALWLLCTANGFWPLWLSAVFKWPLGFCGFLSGDLDKIASAAA